MTDDAAPGRTLARTCPAPDDDDVQRVRGGQNVGGRYVIVGALGEGGVGSVWEAVDQALGRRVALKLLREMRTDLNEAVRLRFQREARTAAAIHHPNVVQVFDYGLDADLGPFLVMELLTGESLSSVISAGQPMLLVELLEWLEPVALALDALHARGLVHRDVKPENILRAQGPGGQVVKLVDFGLAAHADGRDRVTHKGTVLGTPHYMAPEVAQGDQASAASDIYSLGVVAFELLAGSLPHDGDSPLAIAVAKTTTPPPLLSQRTGRLFTVPVELALQRALDLDPSERHTSATDFVQSLVRRRRY